MVKPVIAFEDIVRIADRRPSLESVSFGGDVTGFDDAVAKSGNPVVFQFHHSLGVIEKLATHFGQHPLQVRVGDYSNPEQYHPSKRRFESLTLGTYLAGIRNPASHQDGPTPYAGNQQMPAEVISFLDVPPPTHYRPECFRTPSVWLGGKGSITPLHRDSADNFAFQLAGAKRWTLFPPEEGERLAMSVYEGTGTGGQFAISELNIHDVDHSRYPLFAEATRFAVDVLAGQVLYLPAGWHHHVENLEESLMMNFWLEDTSLSPAFVHLNS